MQRCDGSRVMTCKFAWESVTVVSILSIHLGSVTVIGKVCELSRRCWVEKEVLISPGPSKMYRCHLGSVTVVREV